MVLSENIRHHFVGLLDKYKMVRSNSRKGNCWDNAVAENFFKTRKYLDIQKFGITEKEETHIQDI